MSVLEGRIKSYTAALTLNSRHRQQIKVTFEAVQAFNNVMPRINNVMPRKLSQKPRMNHMFLGAGSMRQVRWAWWPLQ